MAAIDAINALVTVGSDTTNKFYGYNTTGSIGSISGTSTFPIIGGVLQKAAFYYDNSTADIIAGENGDPVIPAGSCRNYLELTFSTAAAANALQAVQIYQTDASGNHPVGGFAITFTSQDMRSNVSNVVRFLLPLGFKLPTASPQQYFRVIVNAQTYDSTSTPTFM